MAGSHGSHRDDLAAAQAVHSLTRQGQLLRRQRVDFLSPHQKMILRLFLLAP
jgi:hypothetical protein